MHTKAKSFLLPRYGRKTLKETEKCTHTHTHTERGGREKENEIGEETEKERGR